MISISGFHIQGSAVALGAITGLTYGLLAVGLVIAYRSSGVINFAHAQIGWFAAAVMAAAVRNWQMPYFIATAIALIVAAGLGAGTEAIVVRRLKRAPAIITAIATIGVAGVLAGLGGVVYKTGQSSGRTYPTPPWLPQFHIGSLLVDRAQTAMLIASPLIIVALALFFRRSRYGLGILGAATNPDAARASGIYTSRLASLAWGIGGALAAYTAILVLPSESLLTGSFGSVLLLRALAAAVIGRMSNLPVVMAAGVAIGVVESTVIWNYPRGGPTELLLFIVILLVLLFRPEPQSRAQEATRRGAFREVEAWGRLPAHIRRMPAVRALGPAVGAIALAAAVIVPMLSSNHAAFILVVILCFAMVGLSVGIVAGLAGELTFGQFALAGVGAAAAIHVTERTGNFFLGLAAAAAAAAVVAVIVELPALRIRGMMLAVSTLGFATSAEFWLFGQSWMFGTEGTNPSKPIIGSITFDTGRKYYFLTLGIFIVAFWVTRNFWAGGLKRRLVAVRDNEQGAKAFAVRVAFVKLQAVALGGALAGVGGAVLAYSLTRVTSQSFLASAGIDVVAMSAVGGISMLAGPLIGVFYIIGLPSFVSLTAIALAGTSLGWLFLLLQKPGGLAQAVSPVRDAVINFVARNQPEAKTEAPPARDLGSSDIPSVGLQAIGSAAVQPSRNGAGGPILEVRNLSKSYAGIRAVQDVSFDLAAGETLGIIGANGAGKTTLFELISGFTKADSGTVSYLGRDITHRSPDARSRLGMVRSFQDAALFPTLTV
ncbi:MAG: ABC transporter permease subunit, partial [Acidimicrobiales bacterium]